MRLSARLSALSSAALWLSLAPAAAASPPATFAYTTDTPVTGALGGRAGADALCEAALPTGVTCKAPHALLSVDASDTLAHMPANYGFDPDGRIEWAGANPGYELLAHDWADLAQGQIGWPESLALGQDTDAWTGTTAAGVVGQTCNGWTTGAATQLGESGSASAADEAFVGEETGVVWGINSATQIYKRTPTGGWQWHPGGLVDIDAGADGAVWGVASNGLVYRLVGSSFLQMPGWNLSKVAVGSKNHVWALDYWGNPYWWNGSGWIYMGGILSDISVGSDGEVWGVNQYGSVYRWAGWGWQQMPGWLKRVAVGNKSHIWGVNGSGSVYRWTGYGWAWVPGQLQHISVGADGSVWGTNYSVPYQRVGGQFVARSGGLIKVAVGRGGGTQCSDKRLIRCVCQATEVAEVQVSVAKRTIAVGEVLTLDAAAVDAAGDVIDAPKTLFTSDPDGLSVQGGALVANAPGFYTVRAASNGVVSDPDLVYVEDPADLEWETLSGVVKVPEGLSAASLQVLGPDGDSYSIAPDGSFSLPRKRFRNQLVTVVDAATTDIRMMAIARGAFDTIPAAQSVTVDLRSTAEALLFLTPRIANPGGEAFESFQILTTNNEPLDALEDVLYGSWVDAGDPFVDPQSIGGLMHAAESDLLTQVDEAVSSIDDPLLATETTYSDTSLPFDPRPIPILASGALVEVVGGSNRTANITLKNRRVRRVDVYLEPAGPNGERLASTEVRFLGALTALPTIGKIIGGIIYGSNPFFSPGSTTFENVDFDPARGGAEEWRLVMYGPGFFGGRYRGIEEDSNLQWLKRSVFPWARTAVLDFGLNVISITTTIDFKGLAEDVAKTLEDVATSISIGGANEAVFLRCYRQGDSCDEALGLIIDLAENLIREAAKKSIKTGGIVAKLGLSELVSKVTVVLDAYDLVVQLIDVGLATLHTATSHHTEVFRIANIYGEIDPKKLDDAETGCAWETELTVIGSLGPFVWDISDPDAPAGLKLTYLDEEHRSVLLSLDVAPASNSQPFFIKVKRLADDNDPSQGFIEVDSQVFILRVGPATPKIAKVEFDAPEYHKGKPGDTLGLTVTATHCQGGNKIDGGDLSGHPVDAKTVKLAAPAAKSREIDMTLTLKNPLQDDPLPLSREQVSVTVKAGAKSATKTVSIDVLNDEPRKVQPEVERYEVEPGGVLKMVILGIDDNFERRTDAEVRAADVKLKNNVAIKTKAPISGARFTLADLTDGLFEFKTVETDALRLKKPHPDNDGTTADASDDNPHEVEIDLTDDDGKSDAFADKVQVVVKNVAPRFASITVAPQLLPPKGTVAQRPFDVVAIVEDDNGKDDIGDVLLDASSLGLGVVKMKNPTGDKRTFTFHVDNLAADCAANACMVQLTAFDKDDEEANQGKTVSAQIPIEERNEPPDLGPDGLLYFQPSPAAPICPGVKLRFAVTAFDPNLDALGATVVVDGVPHAMVPVTPGAQQGTFIFEMPAPSPGTYSYQYFVTELSVLKNPFTVSSPVRTFKVDECPPESFDPDAPPCTEPLGEEICDAIDNDCDGLVDEGFDPSCDPRLHSGSYSAAKTPICRGASVTLRVAVATQGDFAPLVTASIGLSSASMNPVMSGFTFTGRYEVTMQAPNAPGEYQVSFAVDGTAEVLTLPYKIRIEDCCDPQDQIPSLGEGASVAVSEAGTVAYFQPGVGIVRVDGESCDDQVIAVEGPIGSLDIGGDHIVFVDQANPEQPRAVLATPEGELVTLGSDEGSQTKVWIDASVGEAGRVMYVDDREGLPCLYWYDILEVYESPEPVECFSGSKLGPPAIEVEVGGGKAAWIDAGTATVFDLASFEPVAEIGVGSFVSSVDVSSDALVVSKPGFDGLYDLVLYDLETMEPTVVDTQLETDPQPALGAGTLYFNDSVEGESAIMAKLLGADESSEPWALALTEGASKLEVGGSVMLYSEAEAAWALLVLGN